MKKSLKKFVLKLDLDSSERSGAGFAVLYNLRGGTLSLYGTVNDVCTGNNPNCSNQRVCTDTTNAIGCHNYGTCFSD